MVRKLIEDRIRTLGLNYAEVSRALDRNETYLQQFLKRGSPKELREKERFLLAGILKVSEEQLRGPSTLVPKRNYEKRSDPNQNLIDVTTVAGHSVAGASHAAVVPGNEIFGSRIDLPVHGTTLGGGQDGAVTVSEVAVDYATRPPSLLRVQGSYGIIVSGDSMSPEHREGSIALINPHLPPREGTSCVFRNNADKNLLLLKEYVGQTETLWKVHQHSPPKDFTLKKSEWHAAGRTVGNYFP